MLTRPRAGARLALIRATEETLERRPEVAVALVRRSLERSLRRAEAEADRARALRARLAIRAIDVHPVVGERLVRLWLRRARQDVAQP